MRARGSPAASSFARAGYDPRLASTDPCEWSKEDVERRLVRAAAPGQVGGEMQVDLGMRGQEERVTRLVAGRDELLQAPAEDELLGSRLDCASGRFFDCLHLPRTIGARARKAIGPCRDRGGRQLHRRLTDQPCLPPRGPASDHSQRLWLLLHELTARTSPRSSRTL